MGMRIRRSYRDALYDGLMTGLSAHGDLFTYLRNDEATEARRLHHRFKGELRLLDDLGWERDPDAERFELTMPPRELRPIIERVYWSAVSLLNNEPGELVEEAIANLTKPSWRAQRCLPGSPTSSWTAKRARARRRRQRERGYDPYPERRAAWSGDPRAAARTASYAAARGGPDGGQPGRSRPARARLEHGPASDRTLGRAGARYRRRASDTRMRANCRRQAFVLDGR
jgi:hypothetical protein